ncbi:MAG: hypothetical protein GC204_18765 [Chloroflexi bacterium]|nr:hypothetical protein [Chloroflexota bacterium]
MKHQIGYIVDKRVIYIQYLGDLTQEEAEISNVAVIQLIHDGIAPVHVIADAAQLQALKLNLTQMRDVASFLNEPQLGWLMVVGASTVARFISSLIMQWRKTDFRYADSLDEALATLARVDTTLEQTSS